MLKQSVLLVCWLHKEQALFGERRSAFKSNLRVCSPAPLVVSLSRTKKVPRLFWRFKRSLSESRRVIFPKYHLPKWATQNEISRRVQAETGPPPVCRRQRREEHDVLFRLDGVGRRHVVAGYVTALSRRQRASEPPVAFSVTRQRQREEESRGVRKRQRRTRTLVVNVEPLSEPTATYTETTRSY